MKKPTCNAHAALRARCAAGAAATFGRSRVFASKRWQDVDDSADRIAEAIEEREARQRREADLIAADYSGLS